MPPSPAEPQKRRRQAVLFAAGALSGALALRWYDCYTHSEWVVRDDLSAVLIEDERGIVGWE